MFSKVRQIIILAMLCLFQAGLVHAKNIEISGARFGLNGKVTRFVLDVSEKTEPSIFMLADPYRVVIDLPEADWKAAGTVATTGAVGGFRHGLFMPGTYRIVLDLEEPAVVKTTFQLPPKAGYGHRMVVDLEATSRSSFMAAVTASKKAIPEPRSQTAEVFTPKPKVRGAKRVVMLDAGHGGPDPGNLGVIGVHEKVIVLNLVKAMKAELERTGRYEVRLTRDRDIFYPVRERFRIARRNHADLFISVHADSISNKNTKGGSVYNLSEVASDREAGRLAARENKSDVIAGVNLDVVDDEVSGILIDLAQRETMNFSAQFAEMLVAELNGQGVPMLPRGHRYANLGVLKAPDIPSVLLEAGYLTNESNAKFLNSNDGRRKISRAVVKAVDKYFEQMVALGR
ncbi:MAG: N-acetylmuramoyl-L-alanine amidase [Alphaproteobacteria bacterium]|nr:MAG: N-acetylmuramoyl-L-alanine amidase [Alphaproteobacteria bacterium]